VSEDLLEDQVEVLVLDEDNLEMISRIDPYTDETFEHIDFTKLAEVSYFITQSLSHTVS